MSIQSLPDALLLLAPGCAHCPSVLKGLEELIERGALGRLEVVNIQAYPERAEEMGTRSVPWVKIGPFELEGAIGRAELANWAEHAARGSGYGAYYSQLLASRRLDKVVSMVRDQGKGVSELIDLLGHDDTPMGVRIGIGALFEDLQGSEVLNSVLPELGRLTQTATAHTRADACHYLGLTENLAALPFVRPLLQDEDPEVREIAGETLVSLSEKD